MRARQHEQLHVLQPATTAKLRHGLGALAYLRGIESGKAHRRNPHDRLQIVEVGPELFFQQRQGIPNRHGADSMSLLMRTSFVAATVRPP